MDLKTEQVSAEDSRKARRAQYDPANLTEDKKVLLTRRIVVYWMAINRNSAYADFTVKMVESYGWTPEEVRRFLFTQSQRLSKTWNDLSDWEDGHGKISFD